MASSQKIGSLVKFISLVKTKKNNITNNQGQTFLLEKKAEKVLRNPLFALISKIVSRSTDMGNQKA